MRGIGSRDVACRITRGHASGDIAIDGQYGTGNIHAPGLAIGIHRRLVGLGPDFNGNRITGFDFIADLTGDGNSLTRFGRINHVIAGDIINRDRRHWRNRIDTVSVAGIRSGDIACGIARGDGGTNITIRCQHRTRYVDAPGFTIGIHRGLIDLGTDFYGNRIARFGFIANLTGDRNRLAGFAGVNHVIAGDIVDRYRCGWCNRIDAVSMAGISRGDIACGIACGDRSRDIAIRGQHRTRNVHTPGFTIGIHCRLVRFRANFNGNRIARFHFIANLPGDRNRLAGFAGVNHVIAGDVVDSNRCGWCNGIDTVSVAGIRGGDIAGGIACGDGRAHITVRCQHRTRYVDAPGFTVRIDGSLVGLGADFHGNRITGFHFITDLTGDGNCLTGFAGVNHVIGRDVIDRDRSNWCNSIHTISVIRVRSRDVACSITCSDSRTHITVRCQHRTGNVHTPGLTVGIHRRLVGFGTDFYGNRVTRFDVVIDFTGDGYGLAGFSRVNHVIGRDIIDSDRGNWRNGIDTVSVAGVRGGDIACSIACGNGSTHITIGGQHSTGNIHAPGFAIGIDGGLVGFRADFNRDRITRFHFIANLTGDRYRLTGLGRINHVIRGDVINRDRRHRRNRIHTVSVASIGGGDVACRIARGDGRTHITVSGQHRSRNVDAPGLAIGIHRRLVGLGADFNGNRITRFDVVIDFTGHGNRLTGFAGINHVIAGDIVDSDRRDWRNRIHTVSVTGIRSRDIACGIARSHAGGDIAIGCQHGSRDIHAPGLAIGIHRRLVRFGTDGNGDRIAGFHFIADLTGNSNRLTGLAGVNHVVRGDIVDRNRRRWCDSIHTVNVAGIGGGNVACGIARGHTGGDIAIRCQNRSRDVHTPGFAIGIDRRLISLAANFDGNRIACFDIVIDFTRHGNRLTRFAGVNHVIGRDVINRDRRHRRNRIHTVSVRSIGSSHVTGGIARGHGSGDIAIGCQYRPRHIHAPGFAVGIDRRLVGFGADSNGDCIACFHFIANLTRDGNGLPRFAGVNHVIGRDVIN